MESRKAHNLEIGGSNPPPAIRGMYASGKMTESRSGLRFDSGRSILIRLEAVCTQAVYGSGGLLKHSSVVEQWSPKSRAEGSIPSASVPMNCNHWNLFLLLRSVPVFLVGRFMPFKSAHWTFLN